MPTNRRVRGRQRVTQGEIPWGLWSFLTDQDYEPSGDNDGRLITFTHDHGELWNGHRNVVLAWWTRQHPGSRPSLWWRFDAPQPRRRNESELAYLRRHRLLAPGECVP